MSSRYFLHYFCSASTRLFGHPSAEYSHTVVSRQRVFVNAPPP